MAKGYINKEQLSEELQNEIEELQSIPEDIQNQLEELQSIPEDIGDLSQLNTNAKGNLVEAINELNAKLSTDFTNVINAFNTLSEKL